MGREIFYCHACGNRILEDDLRKGRALVFLDKVYCQDCKGQAFEQLNQGGGAALPAAPVASAPPANRPTPAAPAKPAGPPGTRPSRIRQPSSPELKAVQQPPSRIRSGSSANVQLPREAAAPKSKLPLLIGSIVGFVILCVFLVIQVTKTSGDKPQGGSPGKATTSATPVVDPVLAASRAFDEFIATKPAPEAVIEHCTKILPVLKGTHYADKVERAKRRAQDELEKGKGLRELDEEFAKVRQTAEADMGAYAKFPEVMKELNRLLSKAGFDYTDREKPIKEFMARYAGPYEAEAQGVADKVTPVAERLAGADRRPADAVKYIDENFPNRLRSSRAWGQLKSLRDKFQRQAEDEPLPDIVPEPTSWEEYFERAGKGLQEKDYRAALQDYLAGAKLLPPDLSKLGAREKAMAVWGKYNIACLYFIEAAAANGAEKKKNVDSGFEWLFKCGADGILGMTVPDGSGNDVKAADFMAKDPDLDGIRKDPRYEEFLKKFKK